MNTSARLKMVQNCLLFPPYYTTKNVTELNILGTTKYFHQEYFSSMVSVALLFIAKITETEKTLFLVSSVQVVRLSNFAELFL